MTVVNDYSKLAFTEFVDRTVTAYATPAVLAIRAAGAQAPVFCVHPIEGVTSCYAELAAHLDEDHPIYGVQASAIGERPGSLTELASRYADDILAVVGAGPIHLLGLTFGGLLAHAIAVELQGRGIDVDSLTLLGSDPLQPGRAGLQQEMLTRMGDDIDRSRAEELLALATHNEMLANRHFPGVYVGDATIVSAEGSDVGPAWHAFVSGTVRKYLVPDVADFSIIGRLVDAYI